MTGIIDLWNATIPMAFGWDILIMGLALIIIIVCGLFLVKTKTGGIAIMLAGVIYLLSLFEPVFKPVFILLIVLAIISIINGVKNQSR